MPENNRVVEVVPYNPDWVENYLSESRKLQVIFGETIINIYHIGSTAIPDMYAKPIIDIMIEASDINNIDRYNDQLKDIGYTAKGDYGISGRRFFIKGAPKRSHHLHIFQVQDSHISRHLNFRDYIINHPREAQLYAELKRKLAIDFKKDLLSYCKAKESFISDIDLKARDWANNR